MNKISMLSIALSFMAGFAYAEESTTDSSVASAETASTDAAVAVDSPVASESAVATDSPVAEADVAADVAHEAAPVQQPVAKKKKAARKTFSAKSKKEMAACTEKLNSDLTTVQNDQEVRDAVEAQSDKERELEHKVEDLKDTVSDMQVNKADTEKDMHLHDHSDFYSKKAVEAADEKVADAKKELAEAQQELADVKSTPEA